MKSMINWFARNPVAGNAMMVLVLILGFSTWFRLRKEIFPDTSLNVISVRVAYPSASPEDVEKGICIPIEEEVQDLDGIDRLSSTAAEGYGVVQIQVEDDADVQELMNDVRSRVDAIDGFPENAEEPRIEEILLRSQVMSVAVSAQADEATLRQLAERVRDGLLRYERLAPASPMARLAVAMGGERDAGLDYGASSMEWLSTMLGGKAEVTQAEIFGVREYEISIELSDERLAEYGLSFDWVAERIRQASLDLPGGTVRAAGGEVLLRVRNKRYDAQGFADLVLRSEQQGGLLRVGDVATVVDGFEEGRINASLDGRSTVLIDVYRVGEQDTLRLANLTRDYVENVVPRALPDGVEVTIWNDTSVYLQGRLELLARNGMMGLALVTVVLALFLRPSLAFLVALGIPVAFAGALMTLPLTGVSMNMISAFAFILVLGIVVDDAIVVGENVYSRIQRGEDPRLAAPRGTHEVGTVVIFGITTTMVAFAPMLMVGGVSGKIWPNIPWVVIPTLAFSILQSKFVLPGHLAMLKPSAAREKTGWLTRLQQRVAAGLEWVARSWYQPLLNVALRWRYASIAVFVALLVVVLTFVGSGRVPFTFLPNVEADIVAAKLEMSAGTSYEVTDEVVQRLQRTANELNELFRDDEGGDVVRHVFATTGTQVLQTGMGGSTPKGDNLGEVSVELAPAALRSVTSKELIGEWRRLMGSVPGVVELSFVEATGAAGNAFDLELSADSLETLEVASAALREELLGYTGVRDVSDSNRLGKREAMVDVLPEGRVMGFSEMSVGRQVRQAFYGEEVQRLQRERDEVKVMLRFPEQQRESLDFLEGMYLRSDSGAEVPFEQVAEYEYGRGYASIQRSERSRAVTIAADVDKTVEGAVDPNQMVADIEHGFLPRLREQYPDLSWEFRGEQRDQADSMGDLSRGFVLALIGIYILLAIPLRSYVQPFLVMSAIPFGLVGAIVGHLLLGLSFSIMSMCGIIALAGVVVNDSLVLVDYVNRNRAAGASVLDAARGAGAARFRAVILTSLTTFVGLIPMVAETDIQALFLIPMAVALAFGILFATAITLVLVPCFYLVMEDLGRICLKPEVRERRAQRLREAAE